jgi:hypothetical protein
MKSVILLILFLMPWKTIAAVKKNGCRADCELYTTNGDKVGAVVASRSARLLEGQSLDFTYRTGSSVIEFSFSYDYDRYEQDSCYIPIMKTVYVEYDDANKLKGAFSAKANSAGFLKFYSPSISKDLLLVCRAELIK